MTATNQHKDRLLNNGFSITNSIFDTKEIEKIIDLIDNPKNKYAIRQLINIEPKIANIIFSNLAFRKLLSSVCDKGYFLTKAIYFNKPSLSNWFVGYHQDLSISVKERKNTNGFTKWTNKNNQLGVIPPLNIIKNTVTFRIHLDKTDDTNGALKVIPNSHSKSIIRIDKDFNKSNYGKETLCNIDTGGIMIMKPLLLHASEKSTSKNDRRVIHLEFCNHEIPMGWLEKKIIS